MGVVLVMGNLCVIDISLELLPVLRLQYMKMQGSVKCVEAPYLPYIYIYKKS